MHLQTNEPALQASCMPQMLGPWGPVHKKRVLSDKQIKKQKKLSLSIISDAPPKSTRKLALASSFLKVQESESKENHLDTRPNSHGKSMNSVTKLKDEQRKNSRVNQIKGLQPATNYLSFSPEKQEQKQKKIPNNPLVIEKSKNHQNHQNHNLCQKKRPKFFNDSTPVQNSVIPSQSDMKFHSHNTTKPHISPITAQRNLQEDNDRVSQFFIENFSDSNRSSEISIDLQRNNEQICDLKMSQKLSPWKKITNLEEGAATVVSKFDESSRKSESLNHSSVIFRLIGNGDSPTKMNSPLTLKKISSNTESNSAKKHPNITDRTYNGSFRKIKQITEESDLFNEVCLEQVDDAYIPSIELSKDSKQRMTFKKINYLGVGRFANVYLVLQLNTGFVLAIKEILKFTIECNHLEDYLMKEIEIQSKISHPNVLSLYHAFADTKKYHMLLQYGETNLLNILRENGPLSEEVSKKYLRQVVAGLQAIHNAGAVHRDIKPENIIVLNNVCKIGDFGWAAWSNSQGLTQMCGTPGYASPQVMKMQSYTQKTDCWSLGVLAYELVSGALPQSFFQQGIFSSEKINFSSLNVSDGYKVMMKKLLQENEADRPNIGDVASDPLFTNK